MKESKETKKTRNITFRIAVDGRIINLSGRIGSPCATGSSYCACLVSEEFLELVPINLSGLR